MSNYYLLPGNDISKLGLPGGHIKADKTAYQIKDEELAVIQPSLEYLVAVGKISNGEPPEPVAENDEADSGKSAKRLELEAQATELGIEFTDKTSQKELSALIEKALA